ncbi:MAG: TolC family protein [Pontiellaceae bacterium]|nr:TolC family protein [Pontiellaceae bacterium]MBN2785680.1 TolC family protein [Pontiellaceae bacterium]
MKYVIMLGGVLYAATGFAQSASPINLEQALALATDHSSVLQGADLQYRAAEISAAAAGRWTNPNLEFDVEGVGGNLGFYDAAEYTIGLSQDFQRGGKRAAEQQLALRSVESMAHARQEAAVELEVQVRTAFAALQAQQEIGLVRAEQVKLGEAFVDVARRRFDSGAGSELEVVQAELALEEIVLSRACCSGDLTAARERMASLLGLEIDELPELAGSYYETSDAAPQDVKPSHPALRRLDAEIQSILAEAEYARLQDVADVSLGAGVRFMAADDIQTFVLSASMPLVLNRRGRTEHAAGLLQADAARARRQETLRSLRRELKTLLAFREGSIHEVLIIRDRLLPKTEQAYALSRAGYEAGRYSWVELVSAQQHLSEVRVRYIEALAELHRIDAELSRF